MQKRHELSRLFGDMTGSAYAALKADIAQHGLTDPGVHTYEDKVLDGWHRYRAAQELGIADAVQLIPYTGENPIAYVMSKNLHRRQLSASQRAAIVVAATTWAERGRPATKKSDLSPIKTEEDMAETAKVNTRTIRRAKQVQRIAHKRTQEVIEGKVSLNQVLDEEKASHRARDATAELALQSGTTEKDVAEIQKVQQQAPERMDEIRHGTTTPKQVLKAVKMKTAQERKAAREALPPSQERTWLHAPIEQLALHVPAESVDVILTDPPYGKAFLPLWEALAHFAVHALKPGGSLLAMSGHLWLPEVLKAMQPDGITFQWTLCLKMERSTQYMFRGITVNRWKPILWYVKPPRAMGTTLNDYYDGSGMDKQHHEWGQSVGEFYQLLERIAAPGDVVCDPFLGGGTTALAAMHRGCAFIGADIDAECLATTKRRLAEAPA